jgi:hypothetical protein
MLRSLENKSLPEAEMDADGPVPVLNYTLKNCFICSTGFSSEDRVRARSI